MTAILMPNGKQAFSAATGMPLVGGKVYTYAAGTNTPKTTWADALQVGANTNPIILDARGEASIFWSGSYKIVLKDSADVTIWTQDNCSALDLTGSGGAAVIGADDGAGGSLWTTVQGFINYLLSSAGSAVIGFIQAGAGAFVRTVQSKLRERLSSFDFSSGSIISDIIARTMLQDATASINASKAAVQAAGGGTVELPAGTYKLTGDITTGSGSVRFKGAGRGGTRLVQTNGTSNTFVFNGTAFDCSVEDLTISATGTPTAGAGVLQANGTGDIRVNNVRIENVFNGAVQSNPTVAGVLSLSNVDISTTQNDAILIDGSSQFFGTNVVTFGNVAGSGIHCISVAGIWLTNSTIQSSAGFGINLTTGAVKPIYDCYFTNVEIDNCANNGFNVDSTAGGSIYNIQVSNSRSGFGNKAGFAFSGANNENVQILGTSSYKNLNDGFLINNLKDSVISGCQILGNSAGGAGWQGVNINGGTGITITGGTRVGPYHATGNNQAYGIAIQAAFAGILKVEGNDLRGNSTGGIFNASTSTGVTIASNAGHNPVGLAVITVGASPYAYVAGASRETIYIRNGTVSNVTITAPGGTLAVFQATNCTVVLEPFETCTVTYSVVPTMVKNIA